MKHGSALLMRLSSASVALGLCTCLPDDTRDPPGSLVVEVSPERSLLAGAAVTADGWSLGFERFLVVLGEVRLDGDDCDVYSDAGYARIFDALRAEPQRVSVSYGLGRCTVGFGIASPAWDTLRGAGVSAGDETLLRTFGADAHSPGGGVSVHIEGFGERAGRRKRFVWSFRRFLTYEACHLSEQRPEAAVVLAGREKEEVAIVLRATPLFQRELDVDAPLYFEPFREADDRFGDGDGIVTLAELENTPLASDPASSLGKHVYVERLPRVAAYRETGSCRVDASAERPSGFGGP
jgi:hypothetical protein